MILILLVSLIIFIILTVSFVLLLDKLSKIVDKGDDDDL
jgi:hypothetical protein